MRNFFSLRHGSLRRFLLLGSPLGLLFSACVLTVGSSGSLFAQTNWPEFRGPTADGQAAFAELPDAINEDVIKWKTPIHGKGWSSPVIWDGQIWMTTATPDGKTMSAICVSLKSGDIVHDLVLLENEEPDFCHDMNSYATPTPVVTEKHVYVHFGKYGTFCLDRRTGKEVWSQKDFACDHWRGPASSPILYDNKLFVAFDGVDVQYVVAMDAATGDTVWKKDREIKYGTETGDLMKAYGTARVIEINGEPALVYPSAVATIAYRPSDGENIWTVYHGGMNASARPLVTKSGLIIITNGMGRMVAVKPDGKGDITETHVAWSLKKSVPSKSSQVIVEGLMYMADEKGVISCVDPETGKSIWLERVGGSYAASPIVADGKIYFFNMEGDIHVIRPGKEFDLVSKSKLDDGYMASPAVSGNSLILRSRSHLFRIEDQ